MNSIDLETSTFVSLTRTVNREGTLLLLIRISCQMHDSVPQGDYTTTKSDCNKIFCEVNFGKMASKREISLPQLESWNLLEDGGQC